MSAPPPSRLLRDGAAPLTCPTCESDLRAAPDPHAPVLLGPCGHSLCGLCAEAVVVVAAPACPVCSVSITSHSPNDALGALGEAVWAASQPRAAVPPCSDCTRDAAGDPEFDISPVSHKCSVCEKAMCEVHGLVHAKRRGHDAAVLIGPAAARAPSLRCASHPTCDLDLYCRVDGVVLCAKCALNGHRGHEIVEVGVGVEEMAAGVRDRMTAALASAEQSSRGIVVVEKALAALTEARSASITAFQAAMAEVREEVDAHEAAQLGELTGVYKQRAKELAAQASALSVTVSQLHAAAEVCDRALVEGSPQRLGQASVCVAGMAGLAQAFPGPAVPSVLQLVTSTAAAVAAIRAMTWLKTEQMLDDSTVLACLGSAARSALLLALVSWLPRRSTSLLYRASRDGATPAAFHAACDGKGPTLTLIRTDTRRTLGGYSHDSWSSGARPAVAGSFLWGLGECGEPVRLPSRPGVTVTAPEPELCCRLSRAGLVCSWGMGTPDIVVFTPDRDCLLAGVGVFGCNKACQMEVCVIEGTTLTGSRLGEAVLSVTDTGPSLHQALFPAPARLTAHTSYTFVERCVTPSCSGWYAPSVGSTAAVTLADGTTIKYAGTSITPHNGTGMNSGRCAALYVLPAEAAWLLPPGDCGPSFGAGELCVRGATPAGPFDACSFARLGAARGVYDDGACKGEALAGGATFCPTEVEVYAVHEAAQE